MNSRCLSYLRLFMRIKWMIFIGLIVQVSILNALNVKTLGKSVLLMNAENGKVLFYKKGYEPNYPASITKIALALYLLETAPETLNTRCVATQAALEPIDPKVKHSSQYIHPAHLLETDGSHFSIQENEVLPMLTLFYGLMLESGNDAANVIALHLDKDMPSFINRLNTYIRDIGCLQTHFCNPHGLHHPKHVTSAYDMALIMKRAMQFELFNQVIRSSGSVRPATPYQPSRPIVQHNGMVNPNSRHYYPYCLGGKTGYHSRAKQTFVCASQKNDRKLIAVVMGCENSADKYKDAEALFEAAFQEKKQTRQVMKKEQLFIRKLAQANKPICAMMNEDLNFSYYPSEKPVIRAFLQWEVDKLPLKKGDIVGYVKVLDEQQTELVKQPIFVQEDIHMQWHYKILHFFKNWF